MAAVGYIYRTHSVSGEQSEVDVNLTVALHLCGRRFFT